MADSNKDLLNLENKNSSSSTIGLSLYYTYILVSCACVLVHVMLTHSQYVFCAESKLLVCKKNEFHQTQNPKPKPPDGMPFTSSVPKSQGTHEYLFVLAL